MICLHGKNKITANELHDYVVDWLVWYKTSLLGVFGTSIAHGMNACRRLVKVFYNASNLVFIFYQNSVGFGLLLVPKFI